MKRLISKYWRPFVSGMLMGAAGLLMYSDGRRDVCNELYEAAKELHELKEKLDE